MTVERSFYSIAALVMLAITFAGFQPYYLDGEGMSGRQIAPELFTLATHSWSCSTSAHVMSP